MTTDTVQAILDAADELACEAESLGDESGPGCDECGVLDLDLSRLEQAARRLRQAQLDHETAERVRAHIDDREAIGRTSDGRPVYGMGSPLKGRA